MTDVPHVLFVCIHNAGRSQMAAALLDHEAAGRVRVTSAGSAPATEINPAVVRAMAEVGLDLSRELPKPLTGDHVQAANIVITMGCGDACPVYPGKRYLDWDLPTRPDSPWTRSAPSATTFSAAFAASWPNWMREPAPNPSRAVRAVRAQACPAPALPLRPRPRSRTPGVPSPGVASPGVPSPGVPSPRRPLPGRLPQASPPLGRPFPRAPLPRRPIPSPPGGPSLADVGSDGFQGLSPGTLPASGRCPPFPAWGSRGAPELSDPPVSIELEID